MSIRSPFSAVGKPERDAPATGIVDYGLGEAYEVVEFVKDNIQILITLAGMTEQLGTIYTNIGNFGNYALVGHLHTGVYSPVGHDHPDYAPLIHYHTEYAAADHDHDAQYQPIGSYALASHNHDGRYLLSGDAGVAGGALVLDGAGKIPSSFLPALAITKPNVVVSQVAQLALVAEEGDVAIRTDLKRNYIHNGGTSGTMADWTILENATDLVTSVNGQIGTVVLAKADVGLGNVDNTSDVNKPISTAQAASIGTKEPTIAAGTALQYWRGDKTWQTMNKDAVGLGNVDNTSDANKPVSTAQAAAITSAIVAVNDYSVPFTLISAATASEVLLIHVFSQAVNFADDFAGAQKIIGTNPAATFAFDIQKSTAGGAFASVGSISVTNAGVVTFLTTGTTVSFAIGDAMKVVAQAAVDTLANSAFTLKGTKA